MKKEYSRGKNIQPSHFENEVTLRVTKTYIESVAMLDLGK